MLPIGVPVTDQSDTAPELKFQLHKNLKKIFLTLFLIIKYDFKEKIITYRSLMERVVNVNVLPGPVVTLRRVHT